MTTPRRFSTALAAGLAALALAALPAAAGAQSPMPSEDPPEFEITPPFDGPIEPGEGMDDPALHRPVHHAPVITVAMPAGGGTVLHICRKGDGRGGNGLFVHLVSVDVNGVELDDTPTTVPCTVENQITEPNPPLPNGFVDNNGVQVKQAVSECRNGTRHVITYDLTKNPRVELNDQDTGEACTV